MKLRLSIVVIILALGVAGCTAKPADTSSTPASLEAKQGDTQLTGTITAVNNGYLLNTGTETVAIDSYSLDLSEYVDQGQVTVTGQYSGDTLFIATVDQL